MRRMLLALISMLLIGVGFGAMAGLVIPAGAVAGNAPVEYKGATIDGNPSEWSPLSTPVPMYEAGDPTKDNPSNAYLRYDCKNETLNVLVLPKPGFTLIDMSTAAWATIEQPAGNKTAPYNGNYKLYTGASGIDGTPPEFSWIAHDPAESVSIDGTPYAVVDGYEASFSIPPGSYSSLVIHVEFAKNIIDGSGQAGTSANVGFGNASEVTPLLLDCTPTGDVLPDITVTKAADPTSVPETGGDVAFTFTVKNNATEDATITALTDSVFGTLSGDSDCQVGTVLAAGGSCSFELTKSLSGDFPGQHENTFSATVTDNEGNTDTDTNDATVEFTDVLPDIAVTKVADPASVPETGGDVTFRFTVKNNSTEAASITELSDSVFGTLAGDSDCQAGTVLAAGGSCSFELTKSLSGDFPGKHENTFSAIAADDDGNTDTDSADATVTFTDVLPAVTVTKTAGTTSVITGGTVTFTFTVKNDSLEPAVISSLTDSVYGTLSGDADCKVGTILAPGASCSFDFTGVVTGSPASGGLGFDPHVNVFTGTVSDDDGNSASDKDDATVTVLWNGRTPGYWKNKPSSWPAGMVITVNESSVTITTGTLVKQVYSVPSVCFTNGKIDMNADKKDDSLLVSVGYQGGSTLCGGVQILLRAGTAALLNEQVFNGTYPGGSSVQDLYQRINTALLSGDRATMIALASTLDYWNNGIH